MDIQKSVNILCVIICITHKHACLTPVIQFGSHFLSFMNGNHCHFSKCSQTSCILCILSIEQCVCVCFVCVCVCVCVWGGGGGGVVLSGLTIMLSKLLWKSLHTRILPCTLVQALPESTWLLLCPLKLVFSSLLLNFVEVFQVL